MQQQFGLTIGSIVTVPLYKKEPGPRSDHRQRLRHPARTHRALSRGGNRGHVSTDFPSSSPNYSLFTSRGLRPGVPGGPSSGATSSTCGCATDKVTCRCSSRTSTITRARVRRCSVQNEDTSLASVGNRSSRKRPDGGSSCSSRSLAGLALVGQALSRQSLVERESYPTLSALGLRPRQLWGLGLLRAGAIGVVGAVGSVALAYALSDLTPVGEARAAASSLGFVFSGVVVRCRRPRQSWRRWWRWPWCRRGARPRVHVAARARTARGSHQRRRELVARAGAPASAVVGVRNALDRGRGRTSVPVATALVGATVAVIALVATSVFGASLTHLVSTPSPLRSELATRLGKLDDPAVELRLGHDRSPTTR